VNEISRDVEHLAAEVVRECLQDGRGAGAVMARHPLLQGLGDDQKAAVARLVVRTVGALPRLQVALGDRLAGPAARRARVLVRAALVESGDREVSPDLPVPSRGELQSALAAIPGERERFAATHAVPGWLGDAFRAAFGDEAAHVLAGLAEPAPRTLRANLLRVGSRDELIGRLRAEGVDAAPARFAATAVHVRGTRDVFRTTAFADGCFEQQDEASQLAVLATAPPPGGRVLDLCCGSGGKTLALAAAMRNRGAVLATDVHAGRMRELRRRLPRSGADNVRPHELADGIDGDATLAAFARRADRILIDAPCSGTGSWRRRPEARTAIDARGLGEMRATQAALLDRAAGWLAGSARIVYATCSLLPDENERQVEALLERRGDLEVVRLAEILGNEVALPISDPAGAFLSLRPDRHGTDGFFAAVLRRRRSV